MTCTASDVESVRTLLLSIASRNPRMRTFDRSTRSEMTHPELAFEILFNIGTKQEPRWAFKALCQYVQRFNAWDIVIEECTRCPARHYEAWMDMIKQADRAIAELRHELRIREMLAQL